MNILVTGSQGTLGSKLVPELRARGHRVTGADLYHGAVGEIRTDVSEARQVERTFAEVKPEVCYHFAAEFGRVNGQMYYEQLWKTNCLGTRNVIESCLKHGTRLIFSSSSEAYGNLADKGTLLESDIETFVPAFHNEYALTKWTNEQQIRTAIANHDLEATILRFFNVYGPGEFYNDYRSVVCLFIYRVMKRLPVTVYTGTHRSFLYVDDWTRAVANVAERQTPSGEAFNIGSSEYVDLRTLYDLVIREVGSAAKPLTLVPREQSNIASKMPDTSKAIERLHLAESVNLREGIRRTVRWMRSQYA